MPHEAVRESKQEFDRRFVDFYEKWGHIVSTVVQRYIPTSLGDREQLVAEIWAQFLEGKEGKSYLDIYDPTKGSPSTFMWEFSRTRCLQFLSRSERTPTAKAFSIQSQPEESFVVGIVDPETTTALSFDEGLTIEFSDIQRRATDAVHNTRTRGKRDLKWVWYLVCRGYRQDQIAAEMNLSEGTISICMEIIRQIPEVQELRRWAEESGLLEVQALEENG